MLQIGFILIFIYIHLVKILFGIDPQLEGTVACPHDQYLDQLIILIIKVYGFITYESLKEILSFCESNNLLIVNLPDKMIIC